MTTTMDGILSLAAAAIHVVTICQSFGMPALLSLERFGASLKPGGGLVNASGVEIGEGDWITISSRWQTLFRGRAKYRPARLMRYMKGESVELEPDEQQAFADMACAYRYYQQLVKGLKLDQISKLNELIRLVNLELRGEADEALRRRGAPGAAPRSTDSPSTRTRPWPQTIASAWSICAGMA